MKRRKPKRKPIPSPGTSGALAGATSNRIEPASIASGRLGAERASANAIQPALRTLLSLWIAFHLFAILISFTGVVEPSSVHARLSDLVHPYLQPAHFAADDRPVYLAHGDPSEQPHRLQITTSDATDMASLDLAKWKSAGPIGRAGLAVSDRTHRWLSTAAMLAENDQPGLVAELLLPIVESDPSVTAIRIMRFPTDLNDVNEEAESQYVARVIRDNDVISLVQLKSARLSSQAVRPPTGSTQNE